MDANGTRYHLLLGLEDWGACLDPAGAPLRELWPQAARAAKSKPPAPKSEPLLAWDAERAELTLKPRLFKFAAAAGGDRPDISNRRGAARDRYGNWYWIDETSKKIRVNSAGTRRTTDFWPPLAGADARGDEQEGGGFRPRETRQCGDPKLGGLAVTSDHYLVVGTVEPRGILIFDLHAGGAPRRMLWPEGVKFEPFDIAARPEGGVLILDRANKLYWELDRSFAVVVHLGKGEAEVAPPAEDFAPVEGETGATGEAACARPARITTQAAVRLRLHDVLAIDALPDGSALILANRRNQNFARVHRFREGRRVGRSYSTRSLLDLVEPERRAGFNTYGYDFAFVAGRESADGTTAPDRLYVVAADGDQAYSFRIVWRGQKQIVLHPEATFLPMRLFGGKALVAANGAAYYDFGERFIPLVEQRRPRHVTEAVLLTPAGPRGEGEPSRVFDGKEPSCVWHRMMLDACLPPGTLVEVWSRAADELADLTASAWQPEPLPHLRAEGSELPFVGPLNRRSAAAERARREGSGTWELLFQRARGRYLQLRLRLAGDGRSTPRLRALRAYYPRFSYPANYLPAVYREDDVSASFLERFLANPEGVFTALEDRIASVQALFDVRSAPADALDWLADWFGVALDPAWDEPRRRLFIKHAMHFFQYRGTRHGLELALRLVFDRCIDDAAFTVEPCCAAEKSNGSNGSNTSISSQASAVGARGVRIVEQFRSRRAPAASSSAPAATGGPAIVTAGALVRWTPADRGLRLHQLYGERVNAAGAAYPVRDPGGALSAQWQAFSRDVLGFVPAASSADRDAWHDFLARRYANVKNLNAAYKTARTSFADVPLPAQLPADGPALTDWYEFESVVVATRRAAHRFTVLLPVPGTETFDTEAQRARRDLTRRVVELEKPAHTVFDIKFYWAMFRVGHARLGDDTIVDLGGRAPALMPPMALGQEHLAESYLAAAHPQSVREGRTVVGRGDAVKCRPA